MSSLFPRLRGFIVGFGVVDGVKGDVGMLSLVESRRTHRSCSASSLLTSSVIVISGNGEEGNATVLG